MAHSPMWSVRLPCEIKKSCLITPGGKRNKSFFSESSGPSTKVQNICAATFYEKRAVPSCKPDLPSNLMFYILFKSLATTSPMQLNAIFPDQKRKKRELNARNNYHMSEYTHVPRRPCCNSIKGISFLILSTLAVCIHQQQHMCNISHAPSCFTQMCLSLLSGGGGGSDGRLYLARENDTH